MIPAQYKEYISNVVCRTRKGKYHLVHNYLHAERQSNTPRANAAECSVLEEQLVAAHTVIAAHTLFNRGTVQWLPDSSVARCMCNDAAMFTNTDPFHTRKCVCAMPMGMPSSVAVLAEILLRSPQKLFIFIIKFFLCWVKASKNKII